VRISDKTVQKLLDLYKEIHLLGKVSALAHWDLEVNLPPKAGEERSQQLAHLTKLRSQIWQGREFKSLLAEANKRTAKLNKFEKAVIRNLNDTAKFYHRVPQEIIVQESKITSQAFLAWKKAKEENRFSDFLPHLKKVIRLQRTIADHLGYKKNPYDALLDLYEQGTTYAFYAKIFAKLQPELTALVGQIKKSKKYRRQVRTKKSQEEKSYPQQDQEQVAKFIMRKFGYDLAAGRLDIAPHPFETKLARHDVRITTRYHANDFLDSLTGVMHETGHALYEQGVNEEYTATPLQSGVSLGIHESQSRFWENQVGRSHEFAGFIAPVLQAFYHDQLGEASLDELTTLFNQVEPGFIRVEADEVTYNLHVILRFEIENDLINGRLKPEDLPKAWNRKMKQYLGVSPETDREGVLQDIHWSNGMFGYFPTYTLGNLYAAQFTAALKKELNFEDLVAKGEFGTILSWLRDNVHQHGSLYWPKELVKQVTRQGLSSRFFLKYLKDKYSQIYEL
jgi:carboxypeptidase Taq